MAAFFILSCLVVLFMQVIIAAWFYLLFPAVPGRWLLLYAPILMTGIFLFGITYSRAHYTWLGSMFYYFSYTWLGLVFLAFCWCMLCLIAYRLLGWTHIPHAVWSGGSIAGLLLIFAMAFWGGWSSPQVKHIYLNDPAFPTLKIALLSDSHLGMGVSLARFDKAMTRLEQQHPDMLLVLGDVFEYGPHRDQYAARLKKTPFPLGTYGVLGNHEYYVGYGDSKEFFKEAAITLLENTATTAPNGVQLAGLKDIQTAHVTPQQTADLLDTLDPARPTILLSHTPKYAELAAAHHTNLMLSGHTHNGQLWPFIYLVKLQFPRAYGLFDVEGMKFYITSGMFYWGIPLRFLAPAEIPIIHINEHD